MMLVSEMPIISKFQKEDLPSPAHYLQAGFQAPTPLPLPRGPSSPILPLLTIFTSA